MHQLKKWREHWQKVPRWCGHGGTAAITHGLAHTPRTHYSPHPARLPSCSACARAPPPIPPLRVPSSADVICCSVLRRNVCISLCSTPFFLFSTGYCLEVFIISSYLSFALFHVVSCDICTCVRWCEVGFGAGAECGVWVSKLDV